MALKAKKEKAESFGDAAVFNYHERILQDNLTKMINNLDGDHPVRKLLYEHRKINHALSLLGKAREKFNRCGKFECITVEGWQYFSQSVENFKQIDELFRKEENLLFPELVEHGFSTEINYIRAHHQQIHETINQLSAIYEDGISDNYQKNGLAFESVSRKLSRRIRSLMNRKNYILYPRALRIISGQNSWRRIKEIADKMQVRLIKAA